MVSENRVNGTSILVKFNLTRAFTSVYGLVYMIIGMVMPTILMVTILTRSGLQAAPSVASILYFVLAAFLPVFATVGGIGVTYLFSTDRSNGVYEYLIATRKIKIRDIFISYAVATVIVISIILAVDITVAFIVIGKQGHTALIDFLKLVGVFSVPIAYLSSLLSALAMLTWSSLSKTFPGVNSPGGVGTLIGVIPPIVLLLVVERLRTLNPYLYGGVFSIVVFVIFVVVLVVVIKKMSNERMIT